MKGKEEVIPEFNELVNMTADELETWLKSDDSRSAGWPKDEGEGEGGESVGHDSGRKIVEILRENPERKEDEYTDEQVEHMRKVVAYCKRHLAQEAKANSDKSEKEVKESKSYASLKNWGHDFLKAQKANGASKGGKQEKKEDKKQDEEKEEVEEEEEDAEGEEEDGDAKAGDKRKKSGEQNGSSKKRETRQGKGTSTKDDDGEEEEEQVSEEDPDEEQGDSKNGGSKSKGTDKGPDKGDTVSWNWGNGQPEGKVLDVKDEKTTITTKRGNEVSRDGKPEDPAVVIDTGKSKAIKSNHELN